MKFPVTKYLKVMFGENSGADSSVRYQIGEVNVASHWDPTAKSGKDFGGFNFSTESKIIRWLHRGDTLYDVIVPPDAEVIDVVDSATPHGVFRSNKIILQNPRKVTDEMALDFYYKSDIPEVAYYRALGAVALMDYQKTALQIFHDKVNESNVHTVLEEWNEMVHKKGRRQNETVLLIQDMLESLEKKAQNRKKTYLFFFDLYKVYVPSIAFFEKVFL